MFMLRNVTKYIFGDASKESLVDIPQGQLYLVRPLSARGYSELIYPDAAASIRRTGQEFQYQLVIQRAYQEGEEELEADENGEDSIEALGNDKDEKTFLLDQSLEFRSDIRQTGDKIFAWKDLSGDEGDVWEFVCDSLMQPGTVALFGQTALECQYERKYRRSRENATESDLKEFDFTEEEIPEASPVREHSHALEASQTPKALPAADLHNQQTAIMAPKSSAPSTPAKKSAQTVAPVAAKQPEGREILADEAAELHLFDFESGAFILQDPAVKATVSEVGNWDYWLQVTGSDKEWLGRAITDDVNPVFNFEYLSFIFNYFSEDGSAYSWLLRVKDQPTLERFQTGLMQALWEHLNQAKWLKTKESDRDYITEAFNDLTMEDAPEEEEEEEEDEDEFQDAEDTKPRNEEYDSDESQEDVDTQGADGNVNSQLAVGYKHDRSFVVRGSKIGVFKHTADNQLQFSTNISKVQTPKGKLFSPKKVMLHQEDRNMVLQNPNEPNSLYRMDLEYGKVVDEWKVHDDIPVKVFAPENKFAQMTGEQTFLGLSGNALYKIDPRLSGNKLVDDQLKSYVSKNAFSAAATTEKGYIAVASDKGDLRLFDRLGINAKTLVPALGDPIIGVDVSADGRWVLSTTRTYLLLIDALQKEGPNAGKLGFEKAFAKDSKPQPRRLALTPAHVAQFQHETKAPINFTPARFNTSTESSGKAPETSIITATGPFVVTWSLKKILAGRKDPYSIKRYAEEVKADDFKFNTDKNLIVALPNEVNMISNKALSRPTRQSIATPSRAGRTSALRKSDIVNSPY